MSKCSVFRILKSKRSHCTLLRPKYCAWAVVERKRRTRRATTGLRIVSTSDEFHEPPKCPAAASSLPPILLCYAPGRLIVESRGQEVVQSVTPSECGGLPPPSSG